MCRSWLVRQGKRGRGPLRGRAKARRGLTELSRRHRTGLALSGERHGVGPLRGGADHSPEAARPRRSVVHRSLQQAPSHGLAHLRQVAPGQARVPNTGVREGGLSRQGQRLQVAVGHEEVGPVQQGRDQVVDPASWAGDRPDYGTSRYVQLFEGGSPMTNRSRRWQICCRTKP